MIKANIKLSEKSNKSNVFKILLIEPNSKESLFYTELLKNTVECVVECMNYVPDRWDLFENRNYQLVVVDLSTQMDSALSCLEKIKSFLPTVGLIFLSNKNNVDDAVNVIKSGADDYLKKPFTPEKFKLTIKRCLDRRELFKDYQSVSELVSLLNSCQLISATLDEDKIFEIVRNYFHNELNCRYSCVFSSRGRKNELLKSSLADSTDEAAIHLIRAAVNEHRPFQGVQKEPKGYLFLGNKKKSSSMFIFNFKCVDQKELHFVCLSPSLPSYLDSFEKRLHILKNQIEVTGRNIRQYKGVQNLVYIDDLTGLYNSRYLNYILDSQIDQSQNKGLSFAVLFIDVDEFKKVNDQYGHLSGSRILKELSQLIKRQVREEDFVFRYGGDEFIAILSRADIKMAMRVSERIRRGIEKHSFLKREKLKIKITVSIGIALFPVHATQKKELIDVADQNMYQAKRLSRNRVYIAS